MHKERGGKQLSTAAPHLVSGRRLSKKGPVNPPDVFRLLCLESEAGDSGRMKRTRPGDKPGRKGEHQHIHRTANDANSLYWFSRCDYTGLPFIDVSPAIARGTRSE